MNIHPPDGHGSAWGSEPACNGIGQVGGGQLSYWPADIDCQFGSTPLTGDFKSKAVWSLPASHLLIVRHDQGVCDAYAVWALNNGPTAGQSLLAHFSTDYRQQVTTGGPSTHYVKAGAVTVDGSGYGDPIFHSAVASSNVWFNFYYSNNGARLALDGQSGWAGENTNNDGTHGLGMEYGNSQGNRIESGGSTSWWHDVGTIHTGNSNAIGTDKGTSMSSSTYSGAIRSYALYVTNTADAPPVWTC